MIPDGWVPGENIALPMSAFESTYNVTNFDPSWLDGLDEDEASEAEDDGEVNNSGHEVPEGAADASQESSKDGHPSGSEEPTSDLIENNEVAPPTIKTTTAKGKNTSVEATTNKIQPAKAGKAGTSKSSNKGMFPLTSHRSVSSSNS